MTYHTKHFHPAVTACLLAMTVTGLSGCGSSKQKLSVTSSPAGAEVLLQRRGDLEIDVSVPTYGSGGLAAGKFEDDFITLGNAPVQYEFKLSESQGSINIKGAGGSATKHYREGTIRVQLPGFMTVERLVAFSGSAINLEITLQRKN
jgi:hypothetical protein